MILKDTPHMSAASEPIEKKVNARTIIFGEIQRIALEQKRTLGALEDAEPLLSLGLDSLGLAVLVVRLEETLGVDPFSGGDEVDFPDTLGDLVRTYEVAISKG